MLKVGGRQCISLVVIYRKRKQRTVYLLLREKGGLLKFF